MTQPAAQGQALVVGASSTIGRSIAVELVRLGYAATLWGRDGDRLRETAAACAGARTPATVDLVDVTEHERLADLVADVTSRGPLAVVVWAAGLFDWALADEADPLVWARLFDVNLVSAAVRFVVTFPARGCPTEIQLQPQRRV